MTKRSGRTPHQEPRTKAILDLNAAGMESVHIARRLGCSCANVCQALKRNGRTANLKVSKLRKTLTATTDRITPESGNP